MRQFGALSGHRDQVLCVAASDPAKGEPLLATASEDSTVRLWDLRCGGGGRTVRCLCRCFGKRAVTSVAFGPREPFLVFASAGNEILEFDLRKDSGLLVTAPVAKYASAEEEINQVTLHHNGELMAAADDGGGVTVYDTKRRAIVKCIQEAHSNICSSVQFRPRSSSELATGGLDGTLALWELARTRPLGRFDLQKELWPGAAATAADATEALNPPLVHSLSFAADRSQLAAGLGDATVAVVEWRTRSRRVARRLCFHAAAVAAVHHAGFAAAAPLLLSAGNDRKLAAWRCGGDGRPPEPAGEDGLAAPKHGVGAQPDAELASGPPGAPEGAEIAPAAVATLPFKPNWVCSTMAPANAILVAGTGDDVLLFEVPG